nr:MAG TPA: hypothetical protein [Crassvirales sp.]
MAQIRQRKVKVQVTSADPAFKVFKGIYADSNHNTLLTSSKTYDFTLNAGVTKELYIRYTQQPITIIFRSNPNTSYQVSGSFGTVTVISENVTKIVEFPTDTTSDIVIGFTSAISQTSMYKVSGIKINGSAHALPYSMEHVTPGTNITFEVETSLVTTTTTTTSSTTTTSTPAPAVLKLKSNASGTVVKLTTEGLDPETVDLPLSGTSQSSIKIDMKNAPLVDA